jgi:hypothetical protein
MRGASLDGAVLDHAYLGGANLEGVQLYAASSWDGANFSGVKGVPIEVLRELSKNWEIYFDDPETESSKLRR